MNEPIEILVPKRDNVQSTFSQITSLPCLSPFNSVTFSFFERFSKALLAPRYKHLPEVVALGYWLRRQRQAWTETSKSNNIIKPIGLVMHFTPSNVDTMFIYSWFCGMIVGNRNIVRVATHFTESQSILLETLNTLFAEPEFDVLAERNILVRYDKTSNWSSKFSVIADARVLWGGDDSVSHIRSLKSKPRSRDISFADRFSAALIKVDENSLDTDMGVVTQQLLNDTTPYSQQACSSPKILFWQGTTATFEALFRHLDDCLTNEANTQNGALNEHKALGQYAAACQNADVYYGQSAVAILTPDPTYLIPMHSGLNVFFVVKIDDINDLLLHDSEKLQTLSYFGYEKGELQDFVMNNPLIGIDRVVPLGRALDFDVVWDGINILQSLTRSVNIQ